MKNRRVAILGMSFRLPGSTRDSFWPDLVAGKNLVSRVAADRWAQDFFLHPRKSHPGTSYTFIRDGGKVRWMRGTGQIALKES